MTARDHGTPARYVLGPDENDVPGRGCRCTACSQSKWAAERHRLRMIAYGRWQPYVDAGPAREHLRMLAGHGIGWRRAAELAGVPATTVCHILYEYKGRPPVRRVRPETAQAILAVRPSLAVIADSALVDATGTRRRMQALNACGWTQKYLMGRLGMNGKNSSRLVTASKVTAATARAVTVLYDDLWDKRPPETNRQERITAAKARNHARRQGWVLPGAWDDDCIDDPGAEPYREQRRPRLKGAELAAEARELAGFGLTQEQAAERLGVGVGALNKALARYPKTEAGEAA